jgi:ABC-2 type transport system permease protein
MSQSPSVHEFAGPPIALSHRIDPTALLVLFNMNVSRLMRGRRLIVFSFLFALPIVFAILGQSNEFYRPDTVELALIFVLVPQTILPLTALIFASGMIQDEIEEQTLTYLLIRPIPRPLIYGIKLLASWFVTAVLAFVFILITYAAVFEFDATALREVFPWRALETAAAMVLALAAYLSLFGLISLFIRRTMVVGVAYIILLEGVLANVDIVLRKVTIMYQFRVLTIRWLDLKPNDWNIDLSTAPSLTWAALNLGIAIVILTILGAVSFSRREFRLKTPESV